MATKKRFYFIAPPSNSMTLFILLFLTATVFVTVFLVNNFRSPISRADITSTGNNAPSGIHYNLDLVSVPKNRTADLAGGMGSIIFVPISGFCQIKLFQGEFKVLEGNCTDGSSEFQLPNPDPDNGGVTLYSVWIHTLGKVGRSAKITPCAYDEKDQLWCSINSIVLVREKGESLFSNVTKQLLNIYMDLDGDGNTERYNLFSDSLKNYLWQYDENGLRLAQLRFYDISTSVNR